MALLAVVVAELLAVSQRQRLQPRILVVVGKLPQRIPATLAVVAKLPLRTPVVVTQLLTPAIPAAVIGRTA